MKVAILVENYFKDVKLLYTYSRQKEAGYEVDVVGPKADEVYRGKKGGSITSTAASEDINLEEYAGGIITGGWAPDYMRTRSGLVNLVRDANEKGLVVAVICHAA